MSPGQLEALEHPHVISVKDLLDSNRGAVSPKQLAATLNCSIEQAEKLIANPAMLQALMNG
jgi:hypothetical protein